MRRCTDQMPLIADGMMPEQVTESNIADVFAVWAARVADANAEAARQFSIKQQLQEVSE